MLSTHKVHESYAHGERLHYNRQPNNTEINGNLQLVTWAMSAFHDMFVPGTRIQCISCGDESCTCEESCFDDTYSDEELNPWKIAPLGSWSHSYIMRMLSRRKVWYQRFGCKVPNSGTYGISPFANQDPIFYIAHAFTFVNMDMAMRRFQSQSPYFKLDRHKHRECPGNNLDDSSPYIHLVPYKQGTTIGSQHTYAELFEAWSFGNRLYHWVPFGG